MPRGQASPCMRIASASGMMNTVRRSTLLPAIPARASGPTRATGQGNSLGRSWACRAAIVAQRPRQPCLCVRWPARLQERRCARHGGRLGERLGQSRWLRIVVHCHGDAVFCCVETGSPSVDASGSGACRRAALTQQTRSRQHLERARQRGRLESDRGRRRSLGRWWPRIVCLWRSRLVDARRSETPARRSRRVHRRPTTARGLCERRKHMPLRASRPTETTRFGFSSPGPFGGPAGCKRSSVLQAHAGSCACRSAAWRLANGMMPCEHALRT